VVHGHLGGRPPAVDLAAERALGALLADAVGLLTSAHDLSDGGLSQALVESCLRHDVGVAVGLSSDPFVDLFSESAGRALVTVASEDVARLTELAAEHGVPVSHLGTTGGDSLEVGDLFTLPLAELRTAWAATLPAALA
jgi:phosphoribosylformylglycinamidine synthase